MSELADDVARKTLDFIQTCIAETLRSDHPSTTQETLDTQISTTIAVEAALPKLITVQLSKLRHARNTLAYISRLPNELLVLVFTLACETNESIYGEIRRPQKMARIFSVSKTWYRLFQDTPSLWMGVNSHEPTSFIRAAIRKSKQHPLDVRCDHSFLNKDRVPEIFEEVSRWQTADVWVTQSSDLQRLTQSATPFLKSLKLHVRERGAKDRKLRLFLDDAPLLEHLLLQYVLIDWNSPILSGLLSIHLSDITEPTHRQFLGMLSSSPQLLSLHLFHCGFSDAPPVCPTNTTVDLQRLQHLAVMFCPDAFMVVCPGSFRCPAVRNVDIRLKSSNQALEPTVSFLSTFIRNISAASDQMRVVIREKKYTLTFRRESSEEAVGKLHLTHHGPSTEVMERLRITAGFPPTSVYITDMISDDIPSYLKPFSSATSITITRDAEDTVDVLATPMREDKVVRWPMPDLKEIIIGARAFRFVEPCTNIIEMVRSRMGQGNPWGNLPVGADVELPRTLERLVLPKNGGMDRATFQKLRVMLGEERVEWEGTDILDEEQLEELLRTLRSPAAV